LARLSALEVIDTDRLWELMPPYPGEQPVASADLARLYREAGVYAGHKPATQSSAAPVPASGWLAQASAGILDWTAALGTVEGKGSNNWVVDGSRSSSGQPLLA